MCFGKKCVFQVLTLSLLVVVLSGCLGIEGEELVTRFQGISQVASVSPYSVELTWLPVNGVDHYDVYASYSEVPIASTSDTFYEVTDLIPGRSYTFAVSAVYQDGHEEGISIEESITVWEEFKGVQTAVSTSSHKT